MNCPQCGYPKENHHTGSFGMGCYFVLEGQTYAHDDCAMSPCEIELHHAQTRLQLANDLIAVLSHNGLMPENLMTDKGEAWRAWTEEMKK